MRRLPPALAALSLRLAIALAPSEARAADAAGAGPDSRAAAEARAQYQEGTQAFQGKRYAEAAGHFESAASFRPHAVALYTAGLAWDLAGQGARAADAYVRALEVAGLDAKQASTARERIAQIEKTVGTVAITGIASARVKMDDAVEVAVPARLHGAAGERALFVRLAGKDPERTAVMLEAGKVTNFEVVEKSSPKVVVPTVKEDTPAVEPAARPARHARSFWTLRRTAGAFASGVGLAALGGTALLGTSANAAKDAYVAAPSRAGLDHASSLETWTNVSLVAGLVLVTGGIVLVALPDDDGEVHIEAAVGPSGGLVRGTF